MKLNSNNIAAIVTIATAVVTIGYSLYSSNKEKKEFEAYKLEKKSSRNFEAEVDAVSIEDGGLSVELRASLKRLLMAKVEKIENAKTKEALANAICEFDLAMTRIAGKKGDEKIAAIQYLVNDYEEKLKVKEDLRKEKVELDKYKAIGSELVKAINAAGILTNIQSSTGGPFITTDANGVKKYWDGHTFWRV